MTHLFAQAINTDTVPVSAVAGWPKALAIVAIAWLVFLLVVWLGVTMIRAAAVIHVHRGDPDWE